MSQEIKDSSGLVDCASYMWHCNLKVLVLTSILSIVTRLQLLIKFMKLLNVFQENITDILAMCDCLGGGVGCWGCHCNIYFATLRSCNSY